MLLDELLKTKLYRGNKTLLAKDLKISRSTLRLYLKDSYGDYHKIITIANSYQLFTNQTSKVNKPLMNM